MYKNILFDLDGTLTDSAPGITNCVAYALEKFGIRVEDKSELNRFIGPPLIYSFKTFFGFSDKDAELATEYYRERFSTVGLYENALYPGIDVMLKHLKESGRRLLVATSKPEEFTVLILEHFGIKQYFTFICGNTLSESRPEKRDVLMYIMAKYPELSCENTVMVGDRCYDVEGAKAVSLPCIGVSYGFGTQDELEKAGASRIAASVSELERILLAD